MPGGASLGVEGFSYVLDKGYDRLPNGMFLTPKERKQRRQAQQQQQQRENPGQAQQSPTQGAQGYDRGPTSPQSPGFASQQRSNNYEPQDQYSPRDQAFPQQQSYQQDSRQAIDDQPYYQESSRGDLNSSMQDGYYPQAGGRRTYNPQDYQPRGGYEGGAGGGGAGYDDGYGRDNVSSCFHLMVDLTSLGNRPTHVMPFPEIE